MPIYVLKLKVCLCDCVWVTAASNATLSQWLRPEGYWRKDGYTASILLTASLVGSERVWGRPSAEGASRVEAPQAPTRVECGEWVFSSPLGEGPGEGALHL